MNEAVSTARRLSVAAAAVASAGLLQTAALFLPSDLGRLEFLPWALWLAGPLLAALWIRPFLPSALRKGWTLRVALWGTASVGALWILGHVRPVREAGPWAAVIMVSLLLGGPCVGAWLATRAQTAKNDGIAKLA